MKKIFLLSFSIIGVFLTNKLSAQQLGLQTLYNQNNYMINPAAAGIDDCITANLNHRSQWVGVSNNPKVNMLLLDNQLLKVHGFGIDVRNLSSGLLNSFNGKVSYAYHLQLKENHWLSAGLSVGIIQQRFKTTDAIVSDPTDNLLTQESQSDMGFSSDVGLIYRWDKLRIGLAVPQILASGLFVQYGPSSSKFRLVDHMNFYATYEVIDNEKWTASPSILYKNSDYKIHQIDIAMNAMWNDMLGFGLMYRTTYGFAGLLEFKYDQYRFGYSYELGGRNITGVSVGTHEFMIGMKVCD